MVKYFRGYATHLIWMWSTHLLVPHMYELASVELLIKIELLKLGSPRWGLFYFLNNRTRHSPQHYKHHLSHRRYPNSLQNLYARQYLKLKIRARLILFRIVWGSQNCISRVCQTSSQWFFKVDGGFTKILCCRARLERLNTLLLSIKKQAITVFP